MSSSMATVALACLFLASLPMVLAQNSITPGCNTRPSCDGSDDAPCGNGTFWPDACWSQVYYECANGWPAPSICPEPLSFNPVSGVCDIFIGADPPGPCGCDASCAIPPDCPPVTTAPWEKPPPGVEDNGPCDGTILLPHACDCQFYWECNALGIAILRPCGPHDIFSPRHLYSGTCIGIFTGAQENSACLFPENLVVTFEPEFKAALPVAPLPLPERHPIHELLLSLNIPPEKIPAHLRQYTKINYASNTIKQV